MRFLETPPGWERFVEPWWLGQFDEIKKVFRGSALPGDFLAHRIYEHQDWHNLFAKFGILTHYYSGWREDYDDLMSFHPILKEPEWGGLAEWESLEIEFPPEKLPFSPTTINQARVLLRNLRASNVSLPDVESMIHWGGGIGLQTWHMRLWGATHTEYIVDLPVMSAVQEQFLRNNGVNVHLADTEVKEGVVNIVPLSRIELLPERSDVFMALHSLNESTIEAQRYILDRDWFGADGLVLEWTEGHPDFEGSAHWMEIVADLARSGRVPSRAEVRGEEREVVPPERKAAQFEEQFHKPVLFLGRDNWENVADPNGDAMDELAGFLRGGVPIIVVETAHVPRRSNVDWVRHLAESSGYLVYEEEGILLLVLYKLAGNLGLTIPQ